MGLLDKLFGKPKETPGRLTFLCMVRANEIILDSHPLNTTQYTDC
jgi:hypothetical protein